jgi:hypothetical protein
MPVFPGDPTLTPGVGSTGNVKRLDRKNAPTLTKIPVMPISYADALPLLRNLGGAVAPANWRGALCRLLIISAAPTIWQKFASSSNLTGTSNRFTT